MLIAGADHTIIDPPLQLPHAGWGAQTHLYAEGVDSHIEVTALYVDDGHQRAVLLEYDFCLLSPEQANQIRTAVAEALALDFQAVCVKTTHNHAGPQIESEFGGYYGLGDDIRQAYLEMVSRYSVGAASSAHRKAVPASVQVGYAECFAALNRRHKLADRIVTGATWDGPIDPQVLVARIDALDGTPIATLLGYTAHATVLGPENRLISADYPGTAKKVLQSFTGGVVLFLQGSAGNVGPGPQGFRDHPHTARRLGTVLASAAIPAYYQLELDSTQWTLDTVVESGASLALYRRNLPQINDQTVDVLTAIATLPLHRDVSLEEAEADAQSKSAELQKLLSSHAPAEQIRDATFQAKRAAMRLGRIRRYNNQTHGQLEIHFLKIGPLVLGGIPAEPFVEIGLSIKARSPFPATWFGGYTNGWVGYLPTDEGLREGGYEVRSSPFAIGSADALIAAAEAGLHRLAERSGL